MTDWLRDWNFVPLDFLHPFAHPPTPTLAITNLFSESLSVVYKIPHVSEIRWYLSVSIWLILLSVKPQSSPCFHKWQDYLLVYEPWVLMRKISDVQWLHDWIHYNGGRRGTKRPRLEGSQSRGLGTGGPGRGWQCSPVAPCTLILSSRIPLHLVSLMPLLSPEVSVREAAHRPKAKFLHSGTWSYLGTPLQAPGSDGWIINALMVASDRKPTQSC